MASNELVRRTTYVTVSLSCLDLRHGHRHSNPAVLSHCSQRCCSWGSLVPDGINLNTYGLQLLFMLSTIFTVENKTLFKQKRNSHGFDSFILILWVNERLDLMILVIKLSASKQCYQQTAEHLHTLKLCILEDAGFNNFPLTGWYETLVVFLASALMHLPTATAAI
jgi:hypothetical protein